MDSNSIYGLSQFFNPVTGQTTVSLCYSEENTNDFFTLEYYDGQRFVPFDGQNGRVDKDISPLEISYNTNTDFYSGLVREINLGNVPYRPNSEGKINLPAYLSIEEMTAALENMSITVEQLQIGTTSINNTLNGNLSSINILDEAISLAKLGQTIIQGGYIITDLLTADNIRTGSLSSLNGNSVFDLEDGTFHLGDKLSWNGSVLSIDGEINSGTGTIGGWGINDTQIFSIGENFQEDQKIILDSSTKSISLEYLSGNHILLVYQDIEQGGLSEIDGSEIPYNPDFDSYYRSDFIETFYINSALIGIVSNSGSSNFKWKVFCYDVNKNLVIPGIPNGWSQLDGNIEYNTWFSPVGTNYIRILIQETGNIIPFRISLMMPAFFKTSIAKDGLSFSVNEEKMLSVGASGEILTNKFESKAIIDFAQVDLVPQTQIDINDGHYIFDITDTYRRTNPIYVTNRDLNGTAFLNDLACTDFNFQVFFYIKDALGITRYHSCSNIITDAGTFSSDIPNITHIVIMFIKRTTEWSEFLAYLFILKNYQIQIDPIYGLNFKVNSHTLTSIDNDGYISTDLPISIGYQGYEAPINMSSQIVCNNLNADMLDGKHAFDIENSYSLEFPTLTAPLTDWDPSTDAPTSYYQKNGRVYLEGVIRMNGALVDPTLIAFVLPPDYRPFRNQYFIGNSNNAAYSLLIQPSGNVIVTNYNGAWISLCGISFRL